MSKFVAEHAGVEGEVVAGDDRAVEPGGDVVGDVLEYGCIRQHGSADAVYPRRTDRT